MQEIDEKMFNAFKKDYLKWAKANFERKIRGKVGREFCVSVKTTNCNVDGLVQRLSKLNHKERELILYRYGFLDGQAKTLTQTAAEFEISRDRTKYATYEAFRKLRLVSWSIPVGDGGDIITDLY